MNFIDFSNYIELGNYPLRFDEYKEGSRTRRLNLLKDAIKDYLASSIMLPYTDAIKQHGSPALQAEISQRLDTVVQDLNNLIRNHGDDDVRAWSQIWDELCGNIKHYQSTKNCSSAYEEYQDRKLHIEYQHGLYEYYLRRMLNGVKTELEAFINFIIKKGQLIFTKEFDVIINSIRDRPLEFMPIDVFCHRISNSLPINRDITKKTTIHELLMYLQYFEFMTSQFSNKVICFNENFKQANRLRGVIEKVRNKYHNYVTRRETINKNLWRNRIILEEINELVHLINSNAKTIIARIRKDSSGTDENVIREMIERNPYIKKSAIDSLPIRKRTRYYQLYSQTADLKKQQEELATQFEMMYLCLPDGTIDITDADYQELMSCVNYWQNEIPRIVARSVDIRSCINIPTEAAITTFFRNITKPEVDSLLSTGRFMQSPASLEREKWFYCDGARPGAGVSHPYLCTITINSTVFADFMSLRKSDGQFSSVVTKEAEPNCFGVHEDALEKFNGILHKITITNKNNLSYRKIIFPINSCQRVVNTFSEGKPQILPQIIYLFGTDFRKNYRPIYG